MNIMGDIKRRWEVLSREERQKCIDEIIFFFEDERDEEIGIIAAENLLDFILHTVGVRTYNKGVEDSIAFMKDRMEDLQIDMGSLLKVQ